MEVFGFIYMWLLCFALLFEAVAVLFMSMVFRSFRLALLGVIYVVCAVAIGYWIYAYSPSIQDLNQGKTVVTLPRN
jgi:hypothetical protein